MANEILIPEMSGTPKQIVFANHASLSPSSGYDLRITTDGTKETDVELTMSGLANGSYLNSTKFDFGSLRAPLYAIRAAFEMAATPTAGNLIQMFMSYSQSATAGTANPGVPDGSDGSYTGYGTAANAVKQMDLIGWFVCTTAVTSSIQVASCGVFRPAARYGQLILFNNSGAAFHSSNTNNHIVLEPIFEQFQSA